MIMLRDPLFWRSLGGVLLFFAVGSAILAVAALITMVIAFFVGPIGLVIVLVVSVILGLTLSSYSDAKMRRI